MKQVKFRSVLLLLLIVLLGLGLALFCLRYTFRGRRGPPSPPTVMPTPTAWSAPVRCWTATAPSSMTAPPASITRTAPCGRPPSHAVGDQLGNISTSALEAFQSRLIGFDPSPAPSPAVTRCILP